MKRENSSQIIKRIIKISIFSQIILMCLIFFFTKKHIYSIIILIAGIISISSFLLMIKIIDRILKIGKGTGLFFLIELLKMIVIAAVFYPISRISERAILFYILGLSIIIISIMVEGGYQLYRNIFKWNTN